MPEEEAPGSAFWGSLELINTVDPHVDIVMVGQKSSHCQDPVLTSGNHPNIPTHIPSSGMDRRWNPDILFLCHLPGGHDLTGKL